MADTPIDLPYTRHSLSQADIDAVVSALKSPNLTQGPMVGRFEEAFADFVGAKYAVACSSGTAALHMAYAVAGASKDRPVVTSPITFVATANAARACGAKVHFTDTEPTSGLMVPNRLPCPVGLPIVVVPVHLGGHVCDMRNLSQLAQSIASVIVEDASHAFGALYLADGHWHQVGACHHSLMCCFSLHAAKHITSGEGGIITTNDELCVKELRRWRSHGRDDQGWQQSFGWNYRMTDFQAALALSQLQRARGMLARRRRLAALYDEAIGGLHWADPPTRPAWSHGSWHLYAVRVWGNERDRVRSELAKWGIGTQVHYPPVWAHPYWGGFGTKHEYSERTLSLPFFPEMTEADVARVATALEVIVS